MALLFPTLLRSDLCAVTAADLERLGAKGLILDIDNTLTLHGSQTVPPPVRGWLEQRRAEGMRMTVISNNDAARVAPFAGAIGLPYSAKGNKPLPGGFKRAAAQMTLSPGDCVVIGDQIFTDILGANLAGMRSVLLMPLAPEEHEPFIAFKRKLEKPLLALYRRRQRRKAR